MKITSILGARPQFIKAAAISRALKNTGIDDVMIHTGQHFDSDMSDVFFAELDIPLPRFNLGVRQKNHGAMTASMLEGIETVLLREQPALVLVYGDTNSTLAGALAAAKLGIPIAHVEAGMRSYNRRMPEELNRIVADHLSTLLLCATRTAVANLATEGIRSEVHHVGDVMYDTTIYAIAAARARSTIVRRLGLKDGAYAVATIHRAENTDDPTRLQEIIRWLKTRADMQTVVFPMHPRTREALSRKRIDTDGLMTIEPIGFLDMTRLLEGAAEVVTDSGGLQKEAYFHRKPCITLREETEWTETIDNGWNRLWRHEGYAPRRDIIDYGDGHAADRIATLIKETLERTPRPR